MGNSQSSNNEEAFLDSRVIKISDEVARRIFMGPNSPLPDTSKKPQPDNTEVPLPQPQQFNKKDGSHTTDPFYEVLQKHEAMNDAQLTALHKRLNQIIEDFQVPIPKQESADNESNEQKQLLECFKKNPGAVLKCHEDVLEFTSFAKQTMAQP